MAKKKAITETARSTAVEHALEFLTTLLEQSESRNIERLPSLRSLSATCGISLKTIWKAAMILQEQGKIKSISGKGLVSAKLFKQKSSAALSTELLQAVPKSQKWESVADAIRDDLLNGQFSRDGVFPRLKFLQSRYKVSFSTLQHALKQLTLETTLTRHAGHYQISKISSALSNSTIALVGHGNYPGTLNRETPQSEFFLQTLEQELSQQGIRLKILAYNDYRPNGEFLLEEGERSVPPQDDWVLGYLVWTVNIVDIPQYFQKLSLHKRPMAILPQNKNLVIPESVRQNSNNKIFSIGETTHCSETVSKFLIESGHTSVAYISPFHGAHWSQTRYQGTCNVFGAIGREVELHCISDTSSPFDYRKSISESYYDEMVEAGQKLLASSLPGLQIGELMSLRRVIMKTVADHFMLQQLEPIFEKVLLNKDTTAWICADDAVALFALDFLKKKRIAVPQRISVIGFNDTFEAFQRGLTSYNFNVSALVRAMIRHVTMPDYKPLSRKQSLIEINGMIVERKTTGRCRV